MERVPKKRNVISLETKYDIILKSKEGVTVSKLSKDFNLATSTICTILAEKEKYIQAIEDNALRDRKRLKMSTYPKLEEAMAMWFNQTKWLDKLERVARQTKFKVQKRKSQRIIVSRQFQWPLSY